jgi:hypothetical protein
VLAKIVTRQLCSRFRKDPALDNVQKEVAVTETSGQTDRLKIIADRTTNIKTIIAAVVGIVVGVFFAGIYWTDLKTKIDDAYETGKKNTSEIGLIQRSMAALEQFKNDLGRWRGEATKAGPSGPGGGSLNNPSMCPEGQFVVGIETNSNTAPPACIGCLNGLRAICRPLKAQ